MACFEVWISFRNALINIVHSYEDVFINFYKNKVNINTSSILLSPTISIETHNTNIEVFKEEVKINTFNIQVVCDINYGIPLYSPDGHIYTINGVPVYVRTAKVESYE